MIINEKEYNVLKKVQEITWVDYLDEARQIVNEEYCFYIEPNTLISAIEDLLCELDKQKEEYEDRIKYLREETDPNINNYEEELGWLGDDKK